MNQLTRLVNANIKKDKKLSSTPRSLIMNNIPTKSISTPITTASRSLHSSATTYVPFNRSSRSYSSNDNSTHQLFYTPHGIVIGIAFSNRPPKPHTIDPNAALELALLQEQELRKVDNIKVSQLLELEDKAVLGKLTKGQQGTLQKGLQSVQTSIDNDKLTTQTDTTSTLQTIYSKWQQAQDDREEGLRADPNSPLGFDIDDPRFESMYEAQRLLRLQYNEAEDQLERWLESQESKDELFGDHLPDLQQALNDASLKRIAAKNNDNDDDDDDDDDDYDDEFERDRQDVIDRLHLIKLFRLDGRGTSLIVDIRNPTRSRVNRNWLAESDDGFTPQTSQAEFENDKYTFNLADKGPRDDYVAGIDDENNDIDDEFTLTEYDWEVIQRVRKQQLEEGKLELEDGFLGIPHERLEQIGKSFQIQAEQNSRQVAPGWYSAGGIESLQKLEEDELDYVLFGDGKRKPMTPELEQKLGKQEARRTKRREAKIRYWEGVEKKLHQHLEKKLGPLGPMPDPNKNPQAYEKWVKKEAWMKDAVDSKMYKLQYNSPEAVQSRKHSARALLQMEYEIEKERLEDDSLMDAYYMTLMYTPEEIERISQQLDKDELIAKAEIEYALETKANRLMDPLWHQQYRQRQKQNANRLATQRIFEQEYQKGRKQELNQERMNLHLQSLSEEYERGVQRDREEEQRKAIDKYGILFDDDVDIDLRSLNTQQQPQSAERLPEGSLSVDRKHTTMLQDPLTLKRAKTKKTPEQLEQEKLERIKEFYDQVEAFPDIDLVIESNTIPSQVDQKVAIETTKGWFSSWFE